MREIKFRVFNKTLNKMVYSREFHALYAFLNYIDDMKELFEFSELMQFSGLLDCEENEIYESDILLWNKKNYGLIKVICHWDYYCLNQYEIFKQDIKIIGSIHENSELQDK